MKVSSGTQKSSIQFHPEIKITVINWTSFSGKDVLKFIHLDYTLMGCDAMQFY
jgi:hypothetical protein